MEYGNVDRRTLRPNTCGKVGRVLSASDSLWSNPKMAFDPDNALSLSCCCRDRCAECPICMEEFTNGPVYSCPGCDGLLCSTCVSQIKKCPLCRLAYSAWKKPARNKAVERILMVNWSRNRIAAIFAWKKIYLFLIYSLELYGVEIKRKQVWNCSFSRLCSFLLILSLQ